MNKVNLNTISLNSSLLNQIGEVKMGGASGGGGPAPIEKPIGVFIYTTDGEFITSDDWDTANNDKAVGVYVGTDTHMFVIAKEYANNYTIKWGGNNILLDNIATSNDQINAILDFNGAINTEEIISQLSGVTDDSNTIGAPAAEACANYIFPNGGRGYLGSIGEWQMCLDNKTSIIDAMSKCGGKALLNNFWSSTQFNARYSWTCSLRNDTLGNATKDYGSGAFARAFLIV